MTSPHWEVGISVSGQLLSCEENRIAGKKVTESDEVFLLLSLFNHLRHLWECVAMTPYLTLTTRAKECRKYVFEIEFTLQFDYRFFLDQSAKCDNYNITHLCTDPLLRFPSIFLKKNLDTSRLREGDL